MSPRTGRPKSDNPKNTQIKFMADRETVENLEYCAAALNKTKSDIIRIGIQKVKSEIEK